MTDVTLTCLRRAVLLLALAAWGALAAGPSPPRYGMELQETWIALPDGVRLAADLYVPTGAAADAKFPVLLECLPYRKTEARGRNWPLYSYFVQRGYVVARVDIRGTGNSEGTLVPYEYSDIELDDGEAVIDWLAKQRWSTGAVGLFGISWGGFNSIQMAGRHPPALKAFVAVDATDDLYQEDVHYMDGIMHLDSWEMSQDLDNARPGAPDYLMDEAYFRDRFDTPPWMLTWKREQRDGPFWDRASWRNRERQITVPGFHIGGWYDGYRDVIPRMLEHAGGPVKAMIGPWSHAWPHAPYPKPGMEWRHEAGRWRWDDGWPIARIRDRVLNLRGDHTLGVADTESSTHRLRYTAGTGIEAGGPVMWWGDVAHDQRPTDAFSLVYDSAPLTEDLEILGLPRAQLRVSTDAPRAHWFARISDVAPDDDDARDRRARRRAHRTTRGAEIDAPGSGLPATGGQSTHAGFRAARRRHAFWLRRDLRGAAQPADGGRHRGRDQRRQPTLPVGHRALRRTHRTRHLGRSSGQHFDDRNAPHGGRPARPQTQVGGTADLPQ